MHGTEAVLAEEMTQMGLKNVQIARRAVSFEGGKEDLYRANLKLRTAVRILAPFHHFNARNENELYNKIMQFNWSSILGLEQTFAIDAAVFSTYFNHSQFVALKMKDAIVDQFRNKTGHRPSVNLRDPDIRLNIHVDKDRFTLSTDSSGDSLHKRGYRADGAVAPLNEVLASSMLKLSGWNPTIPLLDPMCGSGTTIIEAGLMANNYAPGLFRERFGFMSWKNFDPEIWKKVLAETKKEIIASDAKISGSDISSGAINMSKLGARTANVLGQVRLKQSAFKDTYPEEKTGMLIINPPYGERLTVRDINDMYASLGDHLKTHFAGFEAWILSSNMEAIKHIGLHASKKIDLFNGPIRCKFIQYKLYKGSKKAKNNS